MVQIAGRIAVPWEQPEFVADRQTPGFVLHYSVHVGTAHKDDVIVSDDTGRHEATNFAFSPASTMATSALTWLMTLVRMNDASSHRPRSIRPPSLSGMRR